MYIIGAGFSASLGYPLTSDLLMQFWHRLDDSQFRNDLQRVISFHNPGFDPDDFGSFPNVEELLSQMMVNEQLFFSSGESEGGFTKAQLAALRRTFLLRIADWFHELSREVKLTRPDLSWLRQFRDHVLRENSAIISFNWDMILDRLLFGGGVDSASYGFPLRPFQRPVLVKPHGSLNWFEDDLGRHIKEERRFLLLQGSDEPVYAFKRFRAPRSSTRNYTPMIIPPVYLKSFDRPLFLNLWRKCTQLLSGASRIVFIGYSMSAVDAHAQFILRCGFRNQIEGTLLEGGGRSAPVGAADVAIVNPDRAAALRIRAVAGPRHRCRWISKPIGDLAWEDL